MKLRAYSAQRAGYYDGYEFTRAEKNQLKKLKKLKWVRRGRIISLKKLSNRNSVMMSWAKMDLAHLDSIDAFKGFLLALSEQYLIRGRWRLQNGKCHKFSHREKQWVSQPNVCQKGSKIYEPKKLNYAPCSFEGRMCDPVISDFLGLGTASVTRWRKFSPNTYDTKMFKYSSAERLPKFYKGDFNNFHGKSGKYILKDRKIISDIIIFCHRSEHEHLRIGVIT